MDQRATSVVRQRRLRVELRRIREETGRTQRVVAEDLGWSTSKVVRIETGAVTVSTSDLMALLYYYGIHDPEVVDNLLAVTRARVAGWWDEYRSNFSQQFLNFLAYEDSATRIRQYMGSIVPGLLQTVEYARALMVDYQPDQERLDRGARIRMRRQNLLERPNCPELLFVLDEAAIRRWVGGPDVMLRQLDRLTVLARHPRISLQIVPFTEGMYAGMQGSSFTIFELPSDSDVVILLEEPHRDVILDEPETSSSYVKRFDKLQKIACPVGQVDKIIDPVINWMRLGAAGVEPVIGVTTRSGTPITISSRGRMARIRKGSRAMSSGASRDGDRTPAAGFPPTPRVPDDPGWSGGPTVGLVTAIPEEFAAMRAMLEDSIERYVAHDPALYLLGTLPSRDNELRHPVALTLLGATATNAAANGCANLVRSFPSIIGVIMVGIAAGVPTPHRPDRHVRLGDVVVATQIVDFDHVRAVDGGIEVRRPLSLPSPRLTQCADMLRTDELSGHRPWEQWLESRPPELVGYGRPPEHTDVRQRPLRHPRRDYSGHRKGFPKIHYGPIGSSNRSFRDAAMRDQIAAQHGLIALEMEGAGIGSSSFLNGREWFVVRGISDYGDSHRSELWRRYAALVAAAYVRALLARCLPLEPQQDYQQIVSDSVQ